MPNPGATLEYKLFARGFRVGPKENAEIESHFRAGLPGFLANLDDSLAGLDRHLDAWP